MLCVALVVRGSKPTRGTFLGVFFGVIVLLLFRELNVKLLLFRELNVNSVEVLTLRTVFRP